MFDDFGFACALLFLAQSSRISFTRYFSSSSINCWSFTNGPSEPFGYAWGTSNRFLRMSTYGEVSSPMGGLKEAEDCGVVGGHQHCLSLTVHLGARPRSWRLRRQDILLLLARRRR